MDHRTKNFQSDSSLYYLYIRDINKYPLLTKKEEREILHKVKENNKRAVERLVCSNLKFVINVAFMYRGQGFSLTELINEGNLGLIEAAKRFDVNKNIRFISYAVWWIRQSITRALAEKVRMVRISAEKELLLRRISKKSVKMQQTIGGGLRIDTQDLGKQMGVGREKMEKILEMGQFHSSLSEPLGSDGASSLMDVLEDHHAAPSDQSAIENSQKDFLSRSLGQLNQQEQKVIKMYFGISDEKPYSLEDIGEMIGLSKERVRQIKEKGLANLRSQELPRDILLAA